LTIAISFSQSLIFRYRLKGIHRLDPHPVEVRAQSRYSFGVQLVEPPRSSPGVSHQARVFEDAQVLRDSGTAHRQGTSQLVHGYRTRGELLKDRHARCIAERFEPGL
jgi:hypothetical protein